jgi:hypothetical protein
LSLNAIIPIKGILKGVNMEPVTLILYVALGLLLGAIAIYLAPMILTLCLLTIGGLFMGLIACIVFVINIFKRVFGWKHKR